MNYNDLLFNNTDSCPFTTIKFEDGKSWLRGRSAYIGASDASAILGINPWKTNAQLWHDKVYHEEVQDNSNMDTARGHASESHIRELFAIESGRKVCDGTNLMFVSKDNPFMSCTLDGIIQNEDGTFTDLEIKSIRRNNGEWTDDHIPDYYFCQLLHQLAVTGWGEAIILARFCRNAEYEGAYERVYHVKRSDVQSQIDKLIVKEKEFWDSVIKGKRPALKLPTL